MIGVDTNVLVRLLVQDDVAQVEAAERAILLHGSADEPIVVNAINLAEIAWVLRSRYGYGKPHILELLTGLLEQDDVIALPEEPLHRALDAWAKGRAGLADYLIAELNADHGCSTTVTFDREAAKHPGCQLIP